MDDRIIEFVRGMRAAGVRVSMAESADAMRAVEVLGIADKDLFRQSLRTTLVKESETSPFSRNSSRSTSAPAARRCRTRWRI